MAKRISVHMSLLIVLSMILTTFVAMSTTVEANDMFAMVGFATLNGGTTGGTGGTVVEATSVSQVNSVLSTRRKNKDTSPLIIKFNRKITGSEVIAVKDVSNITFLGVGTSGELEGVGLNIVRSKNIIVQNLKIHHTRAPIDGIGIENSQNIWVDHCEIYNMLGDCNGDGKVDTKGDISGGDVDWYDGLLDAKGESAYITVSWTYFHDAFKTSLVGSSDSDSSDRKMTFHHNIYSNVKSRLPSYRGGTGHMFNNYYVNAESSGINSRVGAKLRIENNVFENVGSGSMDDSGFAEGPIGSYYSNSIGFWDVSNNTFTNCKGNQPTTSTCSFAPPYNYSSVLHPVGQVKSVLMQYAGVGKINGSSTPIVIPTSNNTPTPTPIKTQTPIVTNPSNIVYGDLNGDNNANSLDFATLRLFLVGSIQLSDSQRKASDLNLDGNVNSIDFAYFRQFLLGMITKLPVGSVIVTPAYTSQPANTPNTNGGITHEAEASSNNLKYASIQSNYVTFDATKDAYVEMKQVGSPTSGTATITFVYSNGSGMDLPMEIKVNSTTVESDRAFPSTGSWNTWNTVSVSANMTNGSDNVVRFKTRSSNGGPRLDKIIVSGGSSNYTPAPTNYVVTPTPNNTIPTPYNTIPTQTSQPIAGDIILEPNGSMTLEQAISSIQPGKTIYLKSGSYKHSKTIVIAEGNNGNSGAYKKIASYGNDKPVIDFSAMAENSANRGIVLAGSYWHFKNVSIEGAGDNGMLLAGHRNIIEACTFKYNHDSGLQLSRFNTSYNTKDKWPSYNLIVDCYSRENMDSGIEDADGFAAKLTCGEGNIFRNCKAEYNCDDGWDLYTKSETGAIGVVTLENCEASNNGKLPSGKVTGGDGNGYKLGDDTASVAHILKNCVANYNAKHGFTGNGNPAQIVMQNCTGTGNAQKLFDRLTNAIFR